MAAIKLQKFLGLAPKIATELLPDGAAQVATNTKFYSGDLIPYNLPVVYDNTERTTKVNALHALQDPVSGDLKWLSWTTDVDVAFATQTEGSEQRFYYTGDGVPKVSNYELATSGSEPFPTLSYTLGLPLPDDVPTTTAASFSVVNTTSFERDSGNTAKIITSSDHNFRTGNIITIREFVDDDNDTTPDASTFNSTNTRITVTSDTSFEYYNPGDNISTTADTTGRVDLAGNTQERTHLYTWITPWGEESIGSIPSDELYIKEGQVVTVTGLPTAVPSGGSYTRGLRLYRTLTSASGTEYFKLSDLWFPTDTTKLKRISNVVTATLEYPHNFIVDDRFKLTVTGTYSAFSITGGIVKEVIDVNTFTYLQTAANQVEVPVTAGKMYHDVAENITDTARYWGDGGYSFTDDFLDTNLVDILGSSFNDAPPANLTGIRLSNNNILIGFFDNQLCFSEPDKPHAWPIKHRITFDANIVSVEPISGYIIVLTDSYPYAVSGNDPATMVVSRVDTRYPCLSKRSTVNMGYGVVYATHGGLAVYTLAKGLELVTALLHDWDTWDDDVTPSEIIGHFYNGKYFGTHSGKSFIFEADPKVGGYFSNISETFTAAWTDQVTNKLYFTKDATGDILEWDNEDALLLPMEWKSKTITLKTYLNLGAARVIADYTTSVDEIAAVATYNTAATASNVAAWTSNTELGTYNLDMYDECATYNGDCFTTNSKAALDTTCVTFTLWADKKLKFQTVVCSNEIFRLPSGYRSDTYEIGVSGSARVRAIHIGETPYGLRSA